MPRQQSTISPALLGFIGKYIGDNEGRLSHPYLDLKGRLTIGPGITVNTEDQFTRLNLMVEKNGKRVPASKAEKQTAFQRMMEKKNDLDGGKKDPPAGTFNRKAESYKDDTKIRMSKQAMDAELNRQITRRVGDIRKDVGDAAWSKLSPDQKAAVADLHFNTGSRKGFPSLKQAIVNGDAKAMARESLIFTDKASGARNHERLSRNYEALSGLPRKESEQELATILKNKGEELPNFLQTSFAEAAAKAEADSFAPAEDFRGQDPVTDEPDRDDLTGDPTEAPTDGIRGDPTGGEGDDTGAPSGDGGDPSGGPSGDGGGETASTKSSEADAGTKSALAQRRFAMIDALSRPDGELDDILAKQPADLTRDEARTVMRARIALPPGPEQRQMEAFERAFFENAFGTGPAPLDATGRMIDAGPLQPFPTQPRPALTPDGKPVNKGMQRIASAIARDAERDGKDNAIKALQTGLNMFRRTPGKTTPALRVDGIAGPRTRRALRIATARSGPEQVGEDVAFGRFSRFTDAVVGGRADTGGLTELVGPGAPTRALQATVNGLGRRGRPLRLDGRIGPKTTSAFASSLADNGAERLTRRFGETLGLFDVG